EAQVQDTAVKSAERSLELATNRYNGGVVTYLEVVSAQSSLLANRRTAVDILRRRMTASVLLIKALGGGWDAANLPAAKDLISQSTAHRPYETTDEHRSLLPGRKSFTFWKQIFCDDDGNNRPRARARQRQGNTCTWSLTCTCT